MIFIDEIKVVFNTKLELCGELEINCKSRLVK